jgi:anti-anti-sigma factor
MLSPFEVTREDLAAQGLEVTVFHLQGDLDAHTAPRLEEALRQAIADGCQRLVVECAHLDYISSAGLGVLIETHRAVIGRQGELKLAAMAPAIADIFDILGFSKVIPSCASLDEALGSLGPPVGDEPT